VRGGQALLFSKASPLIRYEAAAAYKTAPIIGFGLETEFQYHNIRNRCSQSTLRGPAIRARRVLMKHSCIVFTQWGISPIIV
jgi:hypothetical protein